MNTIWYTRGWQSLLLSPVSLFFRFVVFVRNWFFRVGLLKVNTFSVPVIVVGNISVGGTGKTPLVIALVKRLQKAGFNPGVVSRGYGAKPAKQPRLVDANTPIHLAGDEPALVARETGAAVSICANRSLAVASLLESNQVDVVISDDGLQHYAMHRDHEIAVVDGQRLLGNARLLPAGPLREPSARLNRTDIIAMQHGAEVAESTRHSQFMSLNLSKQSAPKAGHFHLAITGLVGLADQPHTELTQFNGSTVHAVAGVGNPDRFFASLKSAGLTLVEHVMPDHHGYTAADLSFSDDYPVLVTAKDAVKIRELASTLDLDPFYEVSVEAELDEALTAALDQLVTELS